MSIEARKTAFVKLGSFLNLFSEEQSTYKMLSNKQQAIAKKLHNTIQQAVHHNGWFTQENIYYALRQWAEQLTSEKLESWLSGYSFTEKTPKTIAIIMAGNIPLVGFHDFLCVLLSGNKALIKQSSNDNLLLPLIADFLIEVEPSFKKNIEFNDKKLEHFDAVIATGSNNTARYFEYYFGKKPNIIRKNRNTVAVLTGNETKTQLQKLANDIFRYYGMGCRNVSKLFVPENYDFTLFFEAIFEWNSIINQNKYANNYDYNKAVYLMSELKLLDNGFLLLKEDKTYASPIGVLFYETYKNEEDVYQNLKKNTENIQCIVSNELSEEHLAFGKTQQPALNDYADNVNTLDFLLNL